MPTIWLWGGFRWLCAACRPYFCFLLSTFCFCGSVASGGFPTGFPPRRTAFYDATFGQTWHGTDSLGNLQLPLRFGTSSCRLLRAYPATSWFLLQPVDLH